MSERPTAPAGEGHGHTGYVPSLSRRAARVLKPAVDRVMVAHRRYTCANGDALAGALTYALLVGTAPAVLLTASFAAGTGVAGTAVHGAVRDLAAAVLPAQGAALAARLPVAAESWRPMLVLALGWSVIRTTRALRTGVRAMCGQNAGSGNPFRDALLDAVLAVGLFGCLLAVGVAVSVGGPVLGVPAVWALFTAVLLFAPWRAPGRPTPAAAARAALVTALGCHLLAAAGRHYLAATAALHEELYRSAGLLVGLLVWCGLCARALLRAAAWSSTTQPARRTS
ncbi:YhjD/YihY/BrkB family envelope integrity protein [Streptomyces sp. NPDC012510]|uniref:YhjD/YihY/BrkB family envelope integrity protein n=1 Tax=Streptomyces sp. NPDC012510 TaxID=3364838 RepID=UPI0036EE205A